MREMENAGKNAAQDRRAGKKMRHKIAGVENAGKENAGKDLCRNQDSVCHKPALGVIQSRQLLRLRQTH